MSQISHPADAPQIRTSRSFSTELAPALRISRCGRSWLSKPAWTRSWSERPNREVRTKPGDNAPHDPQFLVSGRCRALSLPLSGPNNLMRSPSRNQILEAPSQGESAMEVAMGQQPGKPKPPGNPPIRPEPRQPQPIEEPPRPIPIPPVERPPPPLVADLAS